MLVLWFFCGCLFSFHTSPVDQSGLLSTVNHEIRKYSTVLLCHSPDHFYLQISVKGLRPHSFLLFPHIYMKIVSCFSCLAVSWLQIIFPGRLCHSVRHSKTSGLYVISAVWVQIIIKRDVWWIFTREDVQFFIIHQLCATPGGIMLWRHRRKVYILHWRAREEGRREEKSRREKRGLK